MAQNSFCKCGARLSALDADGVCLGCHDEAAAKLRRARAGVKFCRACGGEYFKNGYCVDHYRQYHQDAYQRRKAGA